MLTAAQIAALGDERPPGATLRTQLASTITPTAPEWIWKPWILRRGLNLLTARQSVGKTTFAAHLAAAMTRGWALPGDTARPAVRVGFLSLEEPDDRLVARLTAANATLDSVVLFGDVDDVDDEGNRFRRRWSLPKDVGALGAAIIEHDIALVIVDGLGYAITGDSHNYATVGSALAALASEADRTGAAILGLVHPPKGASDPVTAAIGSTAWTAIPRVCLVMGRDPSDESGETRVVSVGKTNYRLPDSALAFTIDEDAIYECGAVVGLHPTSVTPEDIMGAQVSADERAERTEVRDQLSEILADGPVDATEATKRTGASDRALRRAKKELGVVVEQRRNTQGKVEGWDWRLPGGQTYATRRTPSPARTSGTSGTSGFTRDYIDPPSQTYAPASDVRLVSDADLFGGGDR